VSYKARAKKFFFFFFANSVFKYGFSEAVHWVGWLIRFFQLRDAEGVFVVTSKSMGAFCVSTLAGMNAVLSQSP
jgi:hypothetical protein